MYVGFWWEDLRKGDHLEDLDADGWISTWTFNFNHKYIISINIPTNNLQF